MSNSIVRIEQDKTKIVKVKGSKIVACGSDNLLPQRISDIVKYSSTLSSVLTSISEFVSYGDLIANDAIENKLYKNLNKYYNYSEFIKRVSLDYRTYGYAFFEVAPIGNEKFIYHKDASKVRILDDNKGFAYCDDWTDTKENVISFPTEENRKIVMISDYDSNTKDYPLPKWNGASYDAQVESLIAQYNANQFENGVHLSSILLFDFGEVVTGDLSGEDTEEDFYRQQRLKLEKQIKGTSGNKSGKTLVLPTNSGVEKPEYLKFPMDKEGSFLKLQEMTENNIVKANSWYRSLCGLATEGTLGNTQQLKNEWQLAERLIQNIQYRITDAVFKALGFNEEFTFNNQSPLDLVDNIAEVSEILQSSLGSNTKQHLLVALGFEQDIAKKMINDSE